MNQSDEAAHFTMPPQLAALANRGMESGFGPVTAATRKRGLMRIDDYYGSGRTVHDLGPTDWHRMRKILRSESQNPVPRFMQPAWLESEIAVPTLLVSLRYKSQDAHGITQSIREIDLAFRRAAATIEAIRRGGHRGVWAPAIRPERGGLWALDYRRGSFEMLTTFYGGLVTLATSTPVSLAALTSLAWDSAASARRLGSWTVGKFTENPDEGPPQSGSPVSDSEWGVKQTKALTPVMSAAAAAGNGLEFVNNSATGEMRLTIYPAPPAQKTNAREEG